MKKVAVIVPTIREDCIKKFLREWEKEFTAVFVIEDNPKRTFKIKQAEVCHYSWKEINETLGGNSWIIPRRTDCIRSFGFYKAYWADADIIITLDDDCYPLDRNFLQTHLMMLQRQAGKWIGTTTKIKPRGFPFRNLGDGGSIVLNMGFWRGVADLDAPTQLVYGPQDLEPYVGIIPRGAYFPLCGMNIAFKREIMPMMYWLLMGKDYEYDRFGDIWCGIFAKKICDHLGLGIHVGTPAVEHERASNVWRNLGKEYRALEVNETLWEIVDNVKLTKKTVKDCYIELAQKLPMKGNYWNKLKRAMQVWASLF
ncbi:MAG: hypothetical protein FJ044_01230 [Candidatus Cloacimonetes bacterium]|nr:hypothetical protein [Candidatus Cloacimonadota bacterium]